MSSFPANVLAALRELGQKNGRLGGLARAKSMTKEERRRSALKASRAAARVRTERAALKKLADEITERTTLLLKKQKKAKADALKVKKRTEPKERGTQHR